jgi:hypothetical protein
MHWLAVFHLPFVISEELLLLIVGKSPPALAVIKAKQTRRCLKPVNVHHYVVVSVSMESKSKNEVK